jgi:hypothetical protein
MLPTLNFTGFRRGNNYTYTEGKVLAQGRIQRDLVMQDFMSTVSDE